MSKRSKLCVAFAAFAALGVASAPSAHAGIVNGGFESGDLTSWSSIGNASVQDATYGVTPAQGTFQALLTTGDSSLSNGAGGTAVGAASLDTFLGLSAGTLEGMGNGGATNGSAIKQTFTASAGDKIAFKWDFLTNDSQGFDFAFFTLTPQAGVTQLADSNSGLLGPSVTVFSHETGYQSTGPITIGVSGTYTIGFGVVNTADTSFNSGVLVDLVTQNGSTGGNGGGGGSSVPLPAAVFVAPLGAFIARSASKRFRKQQTV
jgi:hypothetical protein